jgi:hypothetical protein
MKIDYAKGAYVMAISLETGRLNVEIAEPGIWPDTTTRFDRAGFITQITLDGKHRFCAVEPGNLWHPGTGGMGLCNEFKCPVPAEEAALGEKFPKFGVGLLTRDEDKPYRFFHRYPCEPFDIAVERIGASVTYTTSPKPCMGYALRNTKRLRVDGNRLSMAVTVENTGDKPVEFDEYCHNFITIEHLPIGPRYYLGMTVTPQDGKGPLSGTSLMGQGNGFTFSGYSGEASMIEAADSEIRRDVPFGWTLSHTDSPAVISETVSVTPVKVAVWAIDHIISPEVLCHFSVRPGSSASWTREWTFDC